MTINVHQVTAGKRLKSHDDALVSRPLSDDDDDMDCPLLGLARWSRGRFSLAIKLLAQSRTTVIEKYFLVKFT
jgi:hypothetical protein